MGCFKIGSATTVGSSETSRVLSIVLLGTYGMSFTEGEWEVERGCWCGGEVMITSAKTVWVSFTISRLLCIPVLFMHTRGGMYPSSKMCTTFTMFYLESMM